MNKYAQNETYTPDSATDGYTTVIQSHTHKEQTFSSMWFNIDAIGVYSVGGV